MRGKHSGTKTRPRDHRSESAGAQPERQAQTWCREAAPPAQSLSLGRPGCATLSQVAWVGDSGYVIMQLDRELIVCFFR